MALLETRGFSVLWATCTFQQVLWRTSLQGRKATEGGLPSKGRRAYSTSFLKPTTCSCDATASGGRNPARPGAPPRHLHCKAACASVPFNPWARRRMRSQGSFLPANGCSGYSSLRPIARSFASAPKSRPLQILLGCSRGGSCGRLCSWPHAQPFRITEDVLPRPPARAPLQSAEPLHLATGEGGWSIGGGRVWGSAGSQAGRHPAPWLCAWTAARQAGILQVQTCRRTGMRCRGKQLLWLNFSSLWVGDTGAGRVTVLGRKWQVVASKGAGKMALPLPGWGEGHTFLGVSTTEHNLA